MALQHFQEGIDPTGLPCISTATLLQMIRAAKPYPEQGMVIWAQTAPDVVTNPELAYFFWGELDGSDVPTGNFYYYNGTSWSLFMVTDGNKLINGSVPLTKLKTTGAVDYDIIQNHPAGTLIWTQPHVAVQDGTLTPAKLVPPDNTNEYLLTCLAGVRSFRLLSTFFGTDLDDNIIAISKLVRAGAAATCYYLRTNAAGTGVEWALIDIANLTAVGASAAQSARRNGANTGWEYYTPSNGRRPVFLNAVVPVYPVAGATGGWLTFDASGSIPALGDYAMLQILVNSSTPGDSGWCKAELRKENGSIELTGNYVNSGAGDNVSTTVQAIVEVTALKSFQYQVTNGGPNPGTAQIDLVGYLSA